MVLLDPTVGSEIRKTRPCLVVSPDQMNRFLRTVVIAPMTSVLRDYPSRVELIFQGKRGQVALDQIRTAGRQRLVEKLGNASSHTVEVVAATLVEMFGP